MEDSVVESIGDYESLVKKYTSGLAVVFFAPWAASSVALSTAAATAAKASGVPLVTLDLSEPEVEEIAVDLGVSQPGAAFLYHSGLKVSDLSSPTTGPELAAALTDLATGKLTPTTEGDDGEGDAQDFVRLKYSETAKGQSVLGGAEAGCCGGGRDYAAVSRLVGYDEAALRSEANLVWWQAVGGGGGGCIC
jgi:hypothetical protein